MASLNKLNVNSLTLFRSLSHTHTDTGKSSSAYTLYWWKKAALKSKENNLYIQFNLVLEIIFFFESDNFASVYSLFGYVSTFFQHFFILLLSRFQRCIYANTKSIAFVVQQWQEQFSCNFVILFFRFAIVIVCYCYFFSKISILKSIMM